MDDARGEGADACQPLLHHEHILQGAEVGQGGDGDEGAMVVGAVGHLLGGDGGRHDVAVAVVQDGGVPVHLPRANQHEVADAFVEEVVAVAVVQVARGVAQKHLGGGAGVGDVSRTVEDDHALIETLDDGLGELVGGGLCL